MYIKDFYALEGILQLHWQDLGLFWPPTYHGLVDLGEEIPLLYSIRENLRTIDISSTTTYLILSMLFFNTSWGWFGGSVLFYRK